MDPAANSWNLVVKVKHGVTLKRFSTYVYGHSMDLNMVNLRTKIVDLFELKPDAHIILTYVDDDGDTVALDTDDELRDATISQHLNPLRINVQLPSATPPAPSLIPDSEKSKTASSPQQIDPLRHVTSAVDDLLNSIPEPFRGSFSKVYHESLSKAVPAVADIVDLVTKVAGSTVMKRTTGESSGTSTRGTPINVNMSKEAVRPSSDLPVKTNEHIPVQKKDEGSISKDKNHMPNNINTSTNELPDYANFSGYLPLDDLLLPPYLSGNMTSHDKGKGSVHDSGKPDITNSIPSELIAEQIRDIPKPYGLQGTAAGELRQSLDFGAIPNSSCLQAGSPFSSNFPPNSHPFRRAGGYHDSMLQTFHKGVRCDGCGMFPIIGDRFKSKLKENYDLCSLCFMEMGIEADYVRIDRPHHTSHKPLKELYNAHSRHRTNGFHFNDYGGRSLRGKLESCYIQDVTVQDGTLMAPSTPFTKIWRMRNNGTFRWPYGTQLVWVNGAQFSNRSSVNLGIPLEGYPVEGDIDVAVDFVSPSQPGIYVSYWQLALPNGQKFGQRVWVLIQVKAQVENSQPDYASGNYCSGLNLNLPPENRCEGASAPLVIMDDNTEFFMKPYELSGSPNNPIQIDTLPAVDGAVPVVPKASYPIIGIEESLPWSSIDTAVTSTEVVTGADTVEQTLLKELESMGFKEIDLNKEVLRLNDYDLLQSVDDLCGYAEWDPVLSELQEMGFSDKEKNKKLLIKYDGSIKRVVMDLIAEEIA